MKELLLALPRLARMLISLVGDRDVPTAAKVVLAAVAVYLVSPIDLIPDFIPWVGFLDDLVIAAVVVDGVKAKEVGDKIKARDIAELLAERL